jgi:hypothetical protein
MEANGIGAQSPLILPPFPQWKDSFLPDIEKFLPGNSSSMEVIVSGSNK